MWCKKISVFFFFKQCGYAKKTLWGLIFFFPVTMFDRQPICPSEPGQCFLQRSQEYRGNSKISISWTKRICVGCSSNQKMKWFLLQSWSAGKHCLKTRIPFGNRKTKLLFCQELKAGYNSEQYSEPVKISWKRGNFSSALMANLSWRAVSVFDSVPIPLTSEELSSNSTGSRLPQES